MTATGPRAIVDRVVLALLMTLLAVGCLALWTVVPAAALWAISQVEGPSTTHLALALVAVPTAIILFAALLVRVNGLYVRVAATIARPADEDRAEFMRGPLEWLIVASLVVAFVALIAWFAFIAEDPFPWTMPAA